MVTSQMQERRTPDLQHSTAEHPYYTLYLPYSQLANQPK